MRDVIFMVSNLPPDKLYILFYVICNAVALVIFSFIFYKNQTSIDKGNSKRLFGKVIIYNIVYFSLKIVWVFIYKHKLFTSVDYYPEAIANLLSFLGASLAAFWWSIYINARVGGKVATSRKARALYSIPLNVIFAILIVMFFTKNMYYANEHGEIMNKFSLILVNVVPFIYAGHAVVVSILSVIKSKAGKSDSPVIELIYPQALFLSGILQVIWPEIPFLCFGSAISMICYYTLTIDKLVSIDALTKLNNRNELDSYLESVLIPSNENLYLMMIDANKFKDINDKYGHIEGDRALKFIADALKRGCKTNNNRPFIARFGGDEFVVICNDVTEEYTTEIRKSIVEALENIVIENNIQYSLTISIGYTKYDPENDTAQTLIAKADENLYEQKKIAHGNEEYKRKKTIFRRK